MRPSPAHTPLPGHASVGIQFETLADLSASVMVSQRKKLFPTPCGRVRLSQSPGAGARLEAFDVNGKNILFPITAGARCNTAGLHMRGTASVELSLVAFGSLRMKSGHLIGNSKSSPKSRSA